MDKALTDLFIKGTASLPDVQQTEGDQFGEWAFRVHGREFLHVRGGSTLHFLLSGEAKAEALKCGYAHQHPDAPQSDMLEVQLRKKHQLIPAMWLARQSYGYIRYGAGPATSGCAPRPGINSLLSESPS